MGGNKILIILLACVLINLLSVGKTKGSAVRVRGNIYYTNYMAEPPQDKHYGFDVHTTEDRWNVRVTPKKENKDAIDYLAAGFDGDKVVWINCFKSHLEPKDTTDGANVAMGGVSKETIPVLSATGHLLGPVVTAYCSGTYFEKVGKSGYALPPTGEFFMGEGKAFEHEATQKFNREKLITSLQIPRQITYYFDARSESTKVEQRLNRKWKQYTDKTNFVFESVAVTATKKGVEFPKRSFVKVYDPKDGGVSAPRQDPQMTDIYVMEATNIVSNTAKVPKIKIPGITWFKDRRFDTPGLVVSYKSNKLLTGKEVRSLPEYEEALASLANGRKRGLTQTLAVALIGVFMFTGFLVMYLRQRRSKNNE